MTGYTPPPPNPYLPGANGVAPGNGYNYRPGGGKGGTAKQVAAIAAFEVVKKYGPRAAKAVFRAITKS